MKNIYGGYENLRESFGDEMMGRMMRKKKVRRRSKTIKPVLAFVVILIIFILIISKESFSYMIFKDHDEIISTNAKANNNSGVAVFKDIINNDRVYGTSDIDTSLKISKAVWTASEKVIIVSKDNLLEGFIALPLSNRYNAPILLNESESLNDSVKKEIQRLHASKITVIGDENQISIKVEEQLVNEGLEVSRIQGKNISELSINVANEIGNSDKYFVVSEEDLNNVMAIGSSAASEEIPIIVLEEDYVNIHKFLKDKGNVYCYFIGKNSDIYDIYSDLNIKKINLRDIYDGNYNILTKFKDNLEFSNLIITSPENPASILCGQAMCGVLNYPMIFVDGDHMYPKMERFLMKNVPTIEKILAIGDETLISEDLLNTGGFVKPFHNAKKYLETPTYDGSNQAVHPDVTFVEDGWNGYKYWMGITPYPNGNDNYENPQILVSNNGIDYKTLEGCKNPLDIPVDVESGGHYSDITMCIVDDVMEVYFRYNPGKVGSNRANNSINMLYRMESKDGINWSNKKLVLSTDTFEESYDYVSPIIVYDEGKYKIWFSNYSADLYYTETVDWKDFKEIEKCTFEKKPSNFRLWHHDIIKTNLGYEIVINGYSDDDFSIQRLYYGISKDGINFSPLIKILDVNPNKGAFDNGSLYKSSLVKLEDEYLLYYSTRNKNGEWRIGLAEDIKLAN